MISNYEIECGYYNLELEPIIYLIPQWASKIIYTDGYNEAVFQGDSTNVTCIKGFDINFTEESSFDERFKFTKSVSIKVNGYMNFSDLYNRFTVILKTKREEYYLVNSDFPSFVTHTYTLNASTNETELVFSSQSNIATLKLTNFEPNNVNSCKEYSTSKIKKVKLTESWASSLSTWQKSLINKGTFSDIEPLQDSINLTEEFDGEKYTVTLGFEIPMSHFKNDWHLKLLQFEENKYRGYIELEDGNVAFVGYNVGLFPSYTINGDIISIRLTETAIRGIAYGNDYVLIDTDIPNTIEYNGASCYTYNWLSTCDWEVEDKPDYITITPTSGQADTQYELTICNTDDETGYAVSEFIIKTCNAMVRPEVVIKNPIYRYTATTETVCSEITNERWVESGTTCSGTHGVDKYVNSVKEISYDDGESWYNSGVESATTLIEANSPDCGYSARTISTGTTCAGTHGVDKCQLIENQESYDYGITWVTVSTSTGSLIETNSYDCGYRERWIESGYTCVGYSKYQNNIKQKSYDSGLTWSIKTPIEESASTLIEEFSTDCGWIDPENQYLTFEGIENITMSCKPLSYHNPQGFNRKKMYYSLDNGETWNLYNTANTVSARAGYTILWRADTYDFFDTAYGVKFKVNGKYKVYGNIKYAFINRESVKDISFKYHALEAAFSGETDLVDASNLIIKSDGVIPSACCQSMFAGCTSLIAAPDLPTPVVRSQGYMYMFRGCTSLTKAPTISASAFTDTNNGDLACASMFAGCTSLTTVPVLPATTLGKECYYSMFSGCTSLTNVPSNMLPATTLAEDCYDSMFKGCTSLTTTPSLPATTLATSAYTSMFSGCTSLTTAPELQVTTAGSGSCASMFAGCTSLTTVPVLPATTLKVYCYQNMFKGCISLTSVPSNMLSATTLAARCYEGMFSGCTRLTTAPTLPATTLANYCYQDMFNGCMSLTTAPSLPATTLAYQCYQSMFQGCRSLTTAPVLSATTLTTYCYQNMFSGCTNLNSITCLATDISASNCTTNWVNGVAASGTFTKDANMTNWPYGDNYNGIPPGWTVVDYTG